MLRTGKNIMLRQTNCGEPDHLARGELAVFISGFSWNEGMTQHHGSVVAALRRTSPKQKCHKVRLVAFVFDEVSVAITISPAQLAIPFDVRS